MEERQVVGITNELSAGTINAIHSEKEVSVVKNTGNVKESIENSFAVTPLHSNTNSTSVKSYQDPSTSWFFLFLVILGQFLYPSANQISLLELSRPLFNIIEIKFCHKFSIFTRTQTISFMAKIY